MNYPKEYIEFVAHFNGTKDFFECHEILEEYWKETTLCQRESVWVWMIQFAVSLYHYRRGNHKGAGKLLSRLLNKWGAYEKSLAELGLDTNSLKKTLTHLEYSLQQNLPYQNINLPIEDTELRQLVRETCARWQVPYNRQKEPYDHFLTHKHKLRDREAIIQDRLDKLCPKK